MQVFDEDSATIGTLTKGYSKVRSTDPKLRHADNPDLLRQLTPAEHARVKDVPAHLIEGLSPTIAHEVLGQGVVYRPFEALGEYLGEALSAVATGRSAARRRSDAREASETLVNEVRIAALAAEVVATLRRPDVDRGTYVGRVVAVDRDVVIMDVGRETGVVHERSVLDRMPRLGETVRMVYAAGRAKVEEKGRAQQLSLGI